MTQTEKVLLKTLAYSDIFHYPLTKEEIWKFLLSDKSISYAEFEKTLANLPKQIVHKDGLYALSDNVSSINVRRENSVELQRKMRIAKRAAYYLSYIPTISLIGLSGGVAMDKASPDDDIDFFIITKQHTLFMTRVWIQAILEILNLRRKRNTTQARDKICVNLLIDETRLSWPVKMQDVYTAHEIVQMKPLFERKSTYDLFIKQNNWVTRFFPNAFANRSVIPGSKWKRNYVSLSALSAIVTLQPFEKIALHLQKYHMKGFQTTEIVTEQILAFHPYDYRIKTLASLNDKLQQLGLLTNK